MFTTSLNKIFAFILFACLFNPAMLRGQDTCSTSAIEIKSNLSGAFIFVDGKFAGDTDITLHLAKGVHEIKVRENIASWNSRVIIDSVFVSGSELQKFDYFFKDFLLLDSSPQDVYVYKNENYLGNTPLYLCTDSGSVSLMKNDFAMKEINLADYKERANINLNFNGIRKDESFLETYWFEVLVSSAAMLGAATAYLKIQADKKFDDYEATHDKKYLDDTNRLDLYAGIAFGALQVNFGYLIYRFLKE